MTDIKTELRKEAEGKASHLPENLEAMSPEEMRRTLHELRVHQIELNMQNEELRRAQADLDASRARYFDLYDLAPVGYCTISEKGIILEANLTTATLLDVARRGPLVKLPLSQFILKEDQHIYYRHRKQLFETGEPQACELRMVKYDGTTFWARLEATARQEDDGAPVCRVVMSDSTIFKLAEDELRESEKQYHTLFEAIADAVFLIDQKTGSLLDVNTAATRMYGFNREEFLRMTAADVSAEPEKTADATSNPVPFIPLRYHRHKDGSVFPVELTANLFELRGRNTIIATSRDITERKKIEEERNQLELQRQHLQKTESLGRMAGAIAHHFNNQLGVVMGNLEMAIDDLPQGVGTINSLTAAMQAAGKAAEMSGLMLTYLGQSFDKREPLDLSDACRRSLPLLKAVMPGDVIMETDLPSPGPIILANAPQMQQVLSNLITNAWEAIGDGRGAIHLRVKTVSPMEITIAYRNPIDWQSLESSYACMEVTDTGYGIEDMDVEKLFDPFFTTKFTGRGMGLAAVMGIVKAHGGVITVESELGRGSAFRVFFPMSGEKVLDQPNNAAQLLATEGGGAVLLVEDEEMVRDMARTMLTGLGFTVLEAKDGVEAVEVFQKRQERIRFVLCDLTMPRVNGWETLTALRKLAPDIPVILASGYDKAHAMSGVHSELPQAFLGKPYRLKGLRDAISQALLNKK